VSVGEALAEARVAAGLSIAEVGERSLIREAVISAMEADDYEACGGRIFVNGYIRSIAAAIGVDPKPLIALYADTLAAEDSKPDPDGSARSAAGESGQADAAGDRAASGERSAGAGDEPKAASEPSEAAEALDPDAAAELAATADESAWYDAFTYEESFAYEESAPDATSLDLPAVGDSPTSVDLPAVDAGPAASASSQAASSQSTGAQAAEAHILGATTVGTQAAGTQAGTPQGGQTAATPGDRDRPSRPVRPVRPEPVRPERSRERRSLKRVAGLAVVLLVIVGAATGELIAHTGHGVAAKAVNAASTHNVVRPADPAPTATPTPTPTPTPSPSPKPPPPPPRVVQLPVAGVWAYGPNGVSDGDSPAIARYAIRDDPSSAWRTSWYTTADFGELKHGTGLLIDMGREVNITSVAFRLLFSGADMSLYLGDTTDRGDMRLAASTSGAGYRVGWGLKGHERARYAVIWCTGLPRDPQGTYQLGLYGAQVRGYAGG
jgi:hypothetical protein